MSLRIITIFRDYKRSLHFVQIAWVMLNKRDIGLTKSFWEASSHAMWKDRFYLKEQQSKGENCRENGANYNMFREPAL